MLIEKIKSVMLGLYALPILNKKKVLNLVGEASNVQSIGVLYDAVDQDFSYENKEHLLPHFEIKTLPIFCKKTKTNAQIFGGISLNEISIFGVISDESARIFLKTRFSCLVNLADVKKPLVRFLMSKSKARYKAGLYSDDYYRVYDLAVKLDEGEACSTSMKFEKLLKHIKISFKS